LIRKDYLIYNDIFFDEDAQAPVVDEPFFIKLNNSAERAVGIPDALYFDTLKSGLFSGYARMELLA